MTGHQHGYFSHKEQMCTVHFYFPFRSPLPFFFCIQLQAMSFSLDYCRCGVCNIAVKKEEFIIKIWWNNYVVTQYNLSADKSCFKRMFCFGHYLSIGMFIFSLVLFCLAHPGTLLFLISEYPLLALVNKMSADKNKFEKLPYMPSGYLMLMEAELIWGLSQNTCYFITVRYYPLFS